MLRTMTFRQDAWSLQQAARIAGAAYLITNATGEFSLALVLPALILVPIFSFEFTIGFWLLVKGARVPERP